MNRKMGFMFLGVMIYAFVLPLVAYAQAIYTFVPSDDAWVNESNLAANYGNNTYLSVKDRSGLAEAYIRFSDEDINSLFGEPIESASLFLYQYQGTNSPGDILNLHSINSEWSESSLSWNARPSYNLAPASSLNITGESNITGWREWGGLENVVSGWVSGANYGLVLENHMDNHKEELFARFYSSEYSDPGLRPYLKVTTVTPEPVSAALFLFGSGVLVCLRNKKYFKKAKKVLDK